MLKLRFFFFHPYLKTCKSKPLLHGLLNLFSKLARKKLESAFLQRKYAKVLLCCDTDYKLRRLYVTTGRDVPVVKRNVNLEQRGRKCLAWKNS